MFPWVDLNRLGAPSGLDAFGFDTQQRPFMPGDMPFPPEWGPPVNEMGGALGIAMNPEVMRRLPSLTPGGAPSIMPLPQGEQPRNQPGPGDNLIGPGNPPIRPISPSGGIQDLNTYGQQAGLSGSRQQLPGGAIDLGIDPLTSPFAPSGVQDLNQHNRLRGMTGPHGGTNPQFFGGGIAPADWSSPPLTSQQQVDLRFPTPWQIDTFMSGPQDNFSSRFNAVFEQPSQFMPGDPFEAERQHQEAGSPWIPQGMTAMAQSAPFDDPRGDSIGPVGGRNTIPTPPGGYGYPTPLPVTQPPPFFNGGMGPGGVPFAPGLLPQGFIPPLPNFSNGPPNMMNPSWTSWASPSFI